MTRPRPMTYRWRLVKCRPAAHPARPPDRVTRCEYDRGCDGELRESGPCSNGRVLPDGAGTTLRAGRGVCANLPKRCRLPSGQKCCPGQAVRRECATSCGGTTPVTTCQETSDRTGGQTCETIPMWAVFQPVHMHYEDRLPQRLVPANWRLRLQHRKRLRVYAGHRVSEPAGLLQHPLRWAVTSTKTCLTAYRRSAQLLRTRLCHVLFDCLIRQRGIIGDCCRGRLAKRRPHHRHQAFPNDGRDQDGR